MTVRLSADYEPIPDIVVITREPVGEHIDETPVIAVEVLSPSNADYDTVVKCELYRQAGVGQYWVVDPRNRTIAVFENTGAKWRQVVALSDGAPSDIVRVGEQDQVEVDLPTVLGPR